MNNRSNNKKYQNLRLWSSRLGKLSRETTPFGSKYLGIRMQESKQEVTKVVSLVKTGGKSTKCIKFPLASGLEIQNVPFTTSSRPRLESRCLRTFAKRTASHAYRACAKSHADICSPLIHSIVSNDSVSGQRWRGSDCVDTQADLDLRCPHILKDIFAWRGPSNI